MRFLCPVNLALNAYSFGLMLLDEALGALAGKPAEVVDGVGPWTSTMATDHLDRL